jgi:SAM-dependent methyltransferase
VGPAPAPLGGRERALALLDAPQAPVSGGYLDLLGERAPPRAGRAQRLMLTTALPRVYERWWRPALGRLAKGPLGSGMEGERRMARELLADGDTMLDIGCGTGAFTRDLAAVVGERGLAIGLDAAPAMLTRAVRETLAAPNVAYVRADAERLPFRPASFDAVCCFAALHLLADPWAALDEIGRVLAAGGRLALLTSHRRRAGPLRDMESGIGAALDVWMFAAGELDAALEQRGFDSIQRRVQGLVQFVGARKA